MSDIKIDGLDELFEEFKKLGPEAAAAISDGALAGALVLEGCVKETIRQSGKSGRSYQRGNKTHQASAPGEAPAIDYGFLINSIGSEREDKGAIVFSNDDAAPYLEFGTAKMQARPFMRKAVDEHGEDVLSAIEAVTRSKIGGGSD